MNKTWSAPGIVTLLLAVLALLQPFSAEAATRYGRATANWSLTTTWSATSCTGATGATVPGAADDVIICTGYTVTQNATYTINSLTVQTGGTLSVGGVSLTVNGATGITGTLTFTSTTGTKTFIGAVTLNAGGVWNSTVNEGFTFRGGLTHNGATFTSGTGTYTFNTNSQAIGGSSPITFGGAVLVSGLLGVITVTNSNTGGVTINGTLNGDNAGSTWINAANATLNYVSSGSANAPMTTGVLTADASGNTVNYARAGNQTLKLPSAGYYHLTTSGGSGTKTAPAGTLNILGNLTVNAGTTFTALTNDPTINVTGNATIGGTYTASNLANPLTIGGNLSVGGTYTGNVAPVNLAGDFTRTGTFTSGTGTFTFNGSGLQTVTGATTFTNMVVNNSGAGLSLASDITASSNATTGSLALTAGVVTTGSNTLIVPRDCNAGLSRTAGWVAGNLQLQFPTGATSCTFHVGDASAYRPIDMSFASVTTAGRLTGTVSQPAGEHPNIATSGLDSTKDVNRYWTLSNPAGGTIAYTSYTAAFNFINPGDFDAGATPASFEIEGWDGAAWYNTTLGTAGATSTSASGLPAISAGAGHDFAVGRKIPNVVSIARASTDPTEPATLVDWTVTFNASVTGVDVTDFALVPGGSVSGASITGVSGSGKTWTVTANTGTGAGNGTLGLNLVDDDTIINAFSTPLGGAGAGNGNFTGGVYTVAYTPLGFAFTDSACVHGIAFGGPGQTCALFSWSPQVAGQNSSNVWITSINTSNVPTRLHATQDRTRNMEFGFSCHDPVANAGRQAAFAGATLPLCQANGATPATWSSPVVTVTFLAGSPSTNTSYLFNYADVGRVDLWMRNSAITTETGNSGTFVVKPGGFVLSGIVPTLDPTGRCAVNPNSVPACATDAAGAKFAKAGEAFTATVTALTVNGKTKADAGTAVDCVVVPADCTPNYGNETAPEGVKLTPSLVAGLGLTNNPAITCSDPLNVMTCDTTTVPTGIPRFGAFASGKATGVNFAWKEAGIITLTPSVLSANYLGAGDATGAVSGNVGRFYAAMFGLTADSITNRADVACPTCTWTYMGERMNAAFTLAAKAADGTTTLQNYNYSATPANNFAKLDPTAAGNPLAFGAVNSTATPTYLTARLDTSLPATGNFVNGNGTANVVAPLAITRSASADGPYALLDIGIAPQDSDGALMAAYNLDTDAVAGNDHTTVARSEVRYGRMKVSNAHGSELLTLPIGVTVQYWNGTNYVTSTTDSATSFASTNVVFTNCQKNLSTGAAPPNNCKPIVAVATPPASVVFVNGVGSFKLSAPGAGNTGSVDLTTNAPSYLPSTTGRATFGVYKGNNNFIYLRESY